MTYKYGQKLPEHVEKSLDQYIERIKSINWYQPSEKIDKEAIEKQVSVVLKGFGCKATIEYRQLKTPKDWDAARDAAWDAARDAAWDAAWDAARDAAWDAARDAARGAARDAAWDAARDAAWDAAWGAYDLLAQHTETYTKKDGTFLHLIPLYEMGLYPIGIVDGKFVVAIPPSKVSFPDIQSGSDEVGNK